ncbi:MAG: hypothetical protein AAFZ65_05740 [Planctomycetota bacterium]
MAETPTLDTSLFEEAHGPDKSPLAFVVYVLFRGLLGTFARLPWAFSEGLVNVLSFLAVRVDRRHTEAARDFIRTAFPELDRAAVEARVRESYRHFARVALESHRMLVRVPLDRLREHYTYEFVGEARELLDRREGLVIASAHVGNWEAGTIGMHALGTHEFYGVAKPVKNNFISRFVYRSRERRGVFILPRRGAMTAAPKIVGGAGILALLLDQRARVKPVIAPFFGRPARCDRSVGVLLRRLDAPVLLSVCYRTERPMHFRFVCGPVIPASELSALNPVQVSTRINQELERMIRVAPDQYFWLHDRYKDADQA